MNNNHYTSTLNLLPIKDIIGLELKKYNKNMDYRTTAFIGESTILPEVLSPTTTIIKEVVNEEMISKKEEESNSCETSVIIISNTDKLSEDRIAVYKAIIKAFEDKKMSRSLTYTMLQSITTIELFSDAITIYTSKPNLFNGETFKTEELIESMRKSLHEDNLNIEVIERKDITVAEYFIKNAY